ncbi:hypothetical protein TBLA_0E00490 [Henningerozyma blattae CBS 6284]|uniref:Small ribosomal subunit protein mS38 n=1 Tax=Henningerozyma blattae (strain ATCC 34711 / CBS 6284 / DSM 70876 / NBRC 10599 / NRRL Y-10934 / UCD 77-7) TaxID=1071380 RepID=I2H408_HENB6|nr:hypothetical protein TBLA_0E00490 [Tetrapisispora blattae CBS 6284]CCH61110.1 hypothetical protein TBLA_0E00490 [Tetrapisispora blattae CBS 6284]
MFKAGLPRFHNPTSHGIRWVVPFFKHTPTITNRSYSIVPSHNTISSSSYQTTLCQAHLFQNTLRTTSFLGVNPSTKHATLTFPETLTPNAVLANPNITFQPVPITDSQEPLQNVTMHLDSVMRKRRKKMKKHKLRKRRRKEKAERRKLGQGR